MLTDDQRADLIARLREQASYSDNTDEARGAMCDAIDALSAATPAEGRESNVTVYYGGQREPHSIAFDDAEGREAVDEREEFEAWLSRVPSDKWEGWMARDVAEDGWHAARAALATAPTMSEGARDAAMRTVQQLGYTYTEGAQQWKPPLGKKPEWLDGGIPPSAARGALECLRDVVSHHENIVAGFSAQRREAWDANDNDTAAYWTREIGVAHRMKEQAERAIAEIDRANGGEGES